VLADFLADEALEKPWEGLDRDMVTRAVLRGVGALAERGRLVRAVTTAVQLVGRSVGGVETVARNVGAMADHLTKALDGQVGGAGRQLENISRLEEMIGNVTHASKDHSDANRRVRDSLRALSSRAEEHEEAVAGLFAVAEQLGKEARGLQEKMGKFRMG